MKKAKNEKNEYFYQITVDVKIPRIFKLLGSWVGANPDKVKALGWLLFGVICHRIDPEAGGSLLSIGAFLYLMFGKKVSVPVKKEESEDDSDDELVMLDDLIDERYGEMYEEAFGDAHLEEIYKSLGLEMSRERKEERI